MLSSLDENKLKIEEEKKFKDEIFWRFPKGQPYYRPARRYKASYRIYVHVPSFGALLKHHV